MSSTKRATTRSIPSSSQTSSVILLTGIFRTERSDRRFRPCRRRSQRREVRKSGIISRSWYDENSFSALAAIARATAPASHGAFLQHPGILSPYRFAVSQSELLSALPLSDPSVLAAVGRGCSVAVACLYTQNIRPSRDPTLPRSPTFQLPSR